MLTSFLAAVILMAHAPWTAAADHSFRNTSPEEPEKYDSEYYLDMLTIRTDHGWREVWDRSDNVYNFSTGSLNVEQWFLRQSLKFSASLSENFRFRYWLDNRNTLAEDNGTRNEIEIEWNFSPRYYFSFYLEPAFWKRENDIGVGIQRRTAINRYLKLIMRVRDFANNFAYEHGDAIECEENIYSTQPLEFTFQMREEAGNLLRFGLNAFFSYRWEKEYNFLDNPGDNYSAAGYGRSLQGWVERDMPDKFMLGFDMKVAEFYNGRDESEETHEIVELLPYIWWYPGGLPQRPDFPGGEGLAFRAGVQFRRERWRREGLEAGEFEKKEILPFFTARFMISPAHILEAGFLSDRYESVRTGMNAGSDLRWENRFKLMWEIVTRGGSSVRVIETIDLDREDWGQFGPHDHFFVMAQICF